MYSALRNHLPLLPRGAAIALASLWYVLMVALAVIGVFQPQAEFTYLAM
jgi:hypothetical protein